MSNTNSEHISIENLASFVKGELSNVEITTIQKHIESCPECSNKLDFTVEFLNPDLSTLEEDLFEEARLRFYQAMEEGLSDPEREILVLKEEALVTSCSIIDSLRNYDFSKTEQDYIRPEERRGKTMQPEKTEDGVRLKEGLRLMAAPKKPQKLKEKSETDPHYEGRYFLCTSENGSVDDNTSEKFATAIKTYGLNGLPLNYRRYITRKYLRLAKLAKPSKDTPRKSSKPGCGRRKRYIPDINQIARTRRRPGGIGLSTR